MKGGEGCIGFEPGRVLKICELVGCRDYDLRSGPPITPSKFGFDKEYSLVNNSDSVLTPAVNGGSIDVGNVAPVVNW
ncbi:hypothetical protein QVD17_00939 [Tagetes erecta]|uniref:Uncharacterized protein n=1 Tax=Tagetes erecta TaxID=13708 RepID=A0AAD8L628_TARER|nr:hypothetical protein QVD17_00939 [Tagetes erecta]